MRLRPALLPLLLLVACSQPAPPAEAPETTPDAAADPATDPTSPGSDAAAMDAAGDPAATAPTDSATGTPPADDDLSNLATSADTLATLRERHGDGNVEVAELPAGEGTTVPGWILFPGNPDPVRVYLDGDGAPSSLVVEGERAAYGSHGVHLGMTMPELQALNGKPFQTSGFGWDYGGNVVDWAEGKLAGQGVTVGFCLPEGDEPAGVANGEAPFPSDAAWVASFVPTVCSLGQQL